MIDFMTGTTGLAVLAALTLGACATGGGSSAANQEVSLRASEGGERVEATCEVGNDLSRWSVVAPTIVSVTRSEKPLTVDCRTAEGSRGTRAFEAVRYGDLPGGGKAGYGYPATLELAMVPEGMSRPAPAAEQAGETGAGQAIAKDGGHPGGQAAMSAPSPVEDMSKLPDIGDDGREGYRRFLAGESPRAFAISDRGRWVRANAVRGAARIALDRCQSYGGRCRLYAVDDEVVWEPKSSSEVAAAY